MKAKSCTDIEVILDYKKIFFCRKNDIINFKEIIYKPNGVGYLLLENDFKFPLSLFILI
jgi:hypothetical protein